MRNYLLIIALLLSNVALSCSCVFPGTAYEELAKHDLVLKAKVRSKKYIDQGFDSYYLVELEIKRVYKGNMKDSLAPLYIRTNPPGPACGISFKNKRKYVIYASKNGDQFETSQCTRTTGSVRKEEKKIVAALTRESIF